MYNPLQQNQQVPGYPTQPTQPQYYQQPNQYPQAPPIPYPAQPAIPGAVPPTPGYNQIPPQPQHIGPAGFGGFHIPQNMDQIKANLTVNLSAISTDIAQAVSNLITYFIQRKDNIAGEIGRVNRKSYNFQVDYMPNSDVNPTFYISTVGGTVNGAAGGALPNFGASTIGNTILNGNVIGNINQSDNYTALESAFNAIIEKFDKIVEVIRANNILNGMFEHGHAVVSVYNGVITLSPSTLILNNHKRDYAKVGMK